MGWRERYRQARFRTALFLIERIDESGGRRTADHEYPGSELGYSEDLGRKLRGFSLSGYIIGDDYYVERDSLRNALQEPGPGKLIHPYHGELLVICKTFRIQETTAEGRIARFDMTFVEAGALTLPFEDIDTQSELVTKRTSALAAVKGAFGRVYSVVGKIYAVTQNIEDTITDVTSTANTARQTLAPSAVYQKFSASVLATANALVFDTALLGDAIVNMFEFGTAEDADEDPLTPENSLDRYEEMRPLLNPEPESVVGDEDPSEVVTFYSGAAAVVSGVGITAVLEYESATQAEGIRDELLVQIDRLIGDEDHGDDEFAASLRDLRAALIEDVDARASALARVEERVFPVSLPSLTIAHWVHGNVDNEQRIIERNSILHPAFCPANEPIEVLL